MECKLCKSKNIEITYRGCIRDGRVGTYTSGYVDMYKCKECNTIWHDDIEKDYKSYYESAEYRNSLEGTSDIDEFYRMHDAENMDKFLYTGTEIFRNKIVADIGCGGGAFCDYLQNVAKEVVAIEPSEIYRKKMTEKGYTVFPYVSNAIKVEKQVDVVVSFDVIEHVENPEVFVKEAYDLLLPNGHAFIGTPTDAPVMRELLGNDYESFLFSTQHPWVLAEGSFSVIAQKCNIKNWEVKYYQRYGLGNCLYWLQNKKPGRHKAYGFISQGMDTLWKADLERQGKADYIVFEFVK